MFLILDQSPTEFSLRLKRLAEHKGHRVLLLTTVEIAHNLTVVFHLSEKDFGLRFFFRDLTITTQDIQGVYCGINAFEPALWERFTFRDAEYAACETQALWLAILRGLPCRVINPPALDSLAGTLLSMPEVLYLACRLGFHIPTVSSLESGKMVADLISGGAAIRVADLGQCWIKEDVPGFNDLSGLGRNENHFRVLEEVPGSSVYVTLVGKDFFSCEADAEGGVVPLPIQSIPRFVKSRLRTLHRRLNLLLAEYSFRISQNGNWIFMECTRPPFYAVKAFGDALLGQVIDYTMAKGE